MVQLISSQAARKDGPISLVRMPVQGDVLLVVRLEDGTDLVPSVVVAQGIVSQHCRHEEEHAIAVGGQNCSRKLSQPYPTPIVRIQHRNPNQMFPAKRR